MAMTRKHTMDEVLRSLSRKKDLIINNLTKTIYILENSKDIGNGSWGKLDFLQKYENFRIERVNILPTRKELEKIVQIKKVNETLLITAVKMLQRSKITDKTVKNKLKKYEKT